MGCEVQPSAVHDIVYCYSQVQLELVIAQSPDKMKGLSFGIQLACNGISQAIFNPIDYYVPSLFCSNVPVSIFLMLLFLVFLFLSKRYKFRERNRVVNIQAIAEEHYERYLDQEEEYMREQQLTEENVTVHA